MNRPLPSLLLLAALLPFLAHAAEPPAPNAVARPGIDERPCRLRDDYCRGYVSGLLASLNASGKVCLPEAIPGPQVENTVRQWLAGNPQFLSQAGADLITSALVKSFPCK